MTFSSAYLLGRIPDEILHVYKKINFPQLIHLNLSNFLFPSPSDLIFYKHNLIFYHNVREYHLFTLPYKMRRFKMLNIQKIHPALINYSQCVIPVKIHKNFEFASNSRGIIMYIEDYSQYFIISINKFHENIEFNLPEFEKIKKVCCGLSHEIFLTTCGKLYGLGNNTDGQLGTDEVTSSIVPIRIHLPDDEFAIDIECGNDFTFVKTRNGNWYSWGNNEYLQLFIDSKENKICKPTLNRLNFFNVDNIKLGACFGIAKKNDSVVEWGSLSCNRMDSSSSHAIYNEFKNVKSIDAFHLNASILLDNGNLYIWGQNYENTFNIDSNYPFIFSPSRVNLDFQVKDSKLMKNFITLIRF